MADEVCNLLTTIQTKYNEIINSNLINEVLDKGLSKTNEVASKKLKQVLDKIGIGRM